MSEAKCYICGGNAIFKVEVIRESCSKGISQL